MDLGRVSLCVVLGVAGCGSATVSPTRGVGPAEVDYPDQWYPLDDPSAIGRDHSGHGIDALPVGLSVLPDATRGRAAHFDSGALVIVPQMQRDFTIAFWLKTNQDGPTGNGWTTGPRIVNADVSGVRLDFGLSLDLDKLAMGAGNPGDPTADATALNSQRSVVDGNWHHVAIQRDGLQGIWRIFVDGTLDASRNGAVGALTLPELISFGDLGNTSPATPGLQADISDARLYSRVLGSAGIAFLATQ
jgi:Concanavalin A-like lectin/glucanases superfamily